VGVPALRLRGLYLILATLAAHFMIVFFATEYQGHVAGSGGIFINSEFASKGIASQQVYWAWLLFGIVAVVLLGSARLVRGRAGRAWRMIRDHELAAPTLGIQPTRYKLIVFSLSSGVIGVEGALFVHLNGSLIVDTFTLQLAIGYLAMVLIGGLDSIVGAVIGAAIVTYLPTKVPDIVSLFIGSGNAATKGPQISVIIYGVLIIVFIVSSPQGIVGWLKGFKLRLGRLSVRRRIGAARPAVD
ncbi:MAG TPA: branched-chain amino acid ABC transporter permease, partial [Jatrophihabitantaceae bacterium]|nr:branched-chain amino acid ABC transporter permease [Jatrophihabitantaceae bacterium]